MGIPELLETGRRLLGLADNPTKENGSSPISNYSSSLGGQKLLQDSCRGFLANYHTSPLD